METMRVWELDKINELLIECKTDDYSLFNIKLMLTIMTSSN